MERRCLRGRVNGISNKLECRQLCPKAAVKSYFVKIQYCDLGRVFRKSDAIESFREGRGSFQKLLEGGGDYPLIPLSFFRQNDFSLRGAGTPQFR